MGRPLFLFVTLADANAIPGRGRLNPAEVGLPYRGADSSVVARMHTPMVVHRFHLGWILGQRFSSSSDAGRISVDSL